MIYLINDLDICALPLTCYRNFLVVKVEMVASEVDKYRNPLSAMTSEHFIVHKTSNRCQSSKRVIYLTSFLLVY